MEFVFLMFGGLALVAGGVGAYFIAWKLSGLRAFVVFIPWLALPFVVLSFAFSASVDPTLTPDQASYNVAMATVLTSIMIAIPWFVSNLVGLILGRRKRKAGPKIAATPRDSAPLARADLSAPPPAEPLLPPADPDYPDWRQYDQPSLSLDELGEMMRTIAARAGIDEQRLPRLGGAGGRDGTFLERDKFDYIYFRQQGGVTSFDHRVVIADQAMYLIFSDIAADQGADAERQAMLARIDPRWGNQWALENAAARERGTQEGA